MNGTLSSTLSTTCPEYTAPDMDSLPFEFEPFEFDPFEFELLGFEPFEFEADFLALCLVLLGGILLR